MKNILITGVSTGIGYGAAREFIVKGYRVFGSVRRQQDADKLKSEFSESFIPILFDLTDHESIYNAVADVKSVLGTEGLDGLINNAGATEAGPLMHFSIESFRKQFEVLVIGQLVVTQAFLPLLGASKNKQQKAGRIVMISSISGETSFPFLGPYASSKHALEGLSKSLRVELKLYGIDVIVIGPGNTNTSIWGKNNRETIELYRGTDYYTPMMNLHAYIENTVPKELLELDFVSKKLVRIFEKRNPKPRYTIVKKRIKYWIFSKVLGEKSRGRFASHMMKIKKL
jgi:NAD(P)-dependent dehydrogenase (short-subunit alcohol dehydrogenase family)